MQACLKAAFDELPGSTDPCPPGGEEVQSSVEELWRPELRADGAQVEDRRDKADQEEGCADANSLEEDPQELPVARPVPCPVRPRCGVDQPPDRDADGQEEEEDDEQLGEANVEHRYRFCQLLFCQSVPPAPIDLRCRLRLCDSP